MEWVHQCRLRDWLNGKPYFLKRSSSSRPPQIPYSSGCPALLRLEYSSHSSLTGQLKQIRLASYFLTLNSSLSCSFVLPLSSDSSGKNTSTSFPRHAA